MSSYSYQAVYVFVLLAAAGTAMILDETPSPPVASSSAAENPAPGGLLGETSYQDGQPRNVYSYPTGKQFSTYTYNGSPSSQYGSAAPVSGNADGSYTHYQNGAHVLPHYVSSFSGFSNMAIAKPYTYYIAHPGDSSPTNYQGARSDINGQPGNDESSHTDDSQNVNSVKAINQASNPDGQRSLLELLSQQESAPASNSLFSSLTSPSFLGNARVQLSFSGGYPSNNPRYTYLTFIIPGDLCTVTQQATGIANGASLQDNLKVSSQMNSYVNRQSPYGTNINTYVAPAGGYGGSDQYHFSGSAVQNPMYANGQTVYGALPAVSQTYSANGGSLVSGGTYLNTIQQHSAAVRSLDDQAQNAEDPKPPKSPSEPASDNMKPNEAPAFAPAARNIST